jgi:UDP-glucose 4-epimerase
MRTLVTGGAGFIGSHLVERLLADGHEVLALDNLSVGRESNLEHLRSNPRLKFVKADIGRREEIETYFKGIDWVFHLAARADIVPSIQEPFEYHRSNVDGTVAVLESARHAGVKRLVYTASSSCYGIPDEVPTPETAEIRPMYPYALTKYLGEWYVRHWAQTYNLPAVCVRFFNVYGPRARTSGTYGAVFGVFLSQMAHGKPLTVVGDGSQTRDFTFVTDAVDALVTACKSDLVGEVMNVGSGGTYSVNALVELLGVKEVIHIPKRPGEPDVTFADVRKIERLLGWKAKVKFSDGVAVMRQEMTRWKDAPLWDAGTIKEATKDWFKYLGKQEV